MTLTQTADNGPSSRRREFEPLPTQLQPKELSKQLRADRVASGSMKASRQIRGAI